MMNPDPREFARAKLAELDRREAKADTAIVRAQHEKELIAAQRVAYEEMLTALGPAPAPDASKLVHVHIGSPPAGNKQGREAIQEPWGEILRRAHAHAPRGEFNYDLVIQVGLSLDPPKPIKKPSCRTQILGYKTRGFVEPVREGVFRLTPKGLKAIGLNEEGPALAGPSLSSSGPAGSPGQSPSQVVRDGSIPSGSTYSVTNGPHSSAAVSHAVNPGGSIM